MYTKQSMGGEKNQRNVTAIGVAGLLVVGALILLIFHQDTSSQNAVSSDRVEGVTEAKSGGYLPPLTCPDGEVTQNGKERQVVYKGVLYFIHSTDEAWVDSNC